MLYYQTCLKLTLSLHNGSFTRKKKISRRTRVKGLLLHYISSKLFNFERFEDLKAMLLKIHVVWNVTDC